MIGGGPYIIDFKQSAKSDLFELEKYIVEEYDRLLTIPSSPETLNREQIKKVDSL